MADVFGIRLSRSRTFTYKIDTHRGRRWGDAYVKNAFEVGRNSTPYNNSKNNSITSDREIVQRSKND